MLAYFTWLKNASIQNMTTQETSNFAKESCLDFFRQFLELKDMDPDTVSLKTTFHE